MGKGEGQTGEEEGLTGEGEGLTSEGIPLSRYVRGSGNTWYI